MKTFIVSIIAVLVFGSVCFAGQNNYGSRPYKDAWGNSYKYPNNLYKDTDRDGIINYNDYNDRNRNIQTPYQKDYNYNYDKRNYNKRGW